MRFIAVKLGLVLLFLCCLEPVWAQNIQGGKEEIFVNRFFSENRFFLKGQLFERQELPDIEPAPDEFSVSAEPAANEQNPELNDLLAEEENTLVQKADAEKENLPAQEPASAVSKEETKKDEDPFYDDWDDLMLFETAGMVYEVPPLIIEPRSFDEIFPGLTRTQKRNARTATGLRHAFEKDEPPMFLPAENSGINLIDFVMDKKPSHVVEALVLIPYDKRELDMLDAYNAMSGISLIKDQTIPYRNSQYQVFKDTTRLESAKNRKPIPDPAPADTLPYSERMYLRFTDTTIGEIFLQGDITPGLYGITYSMTNFRDVNYTIFKVMKAEKFSAVIYVEPVKEGVVIYGMSGLYLPGFIVNRMNLPSNMNYRITALLNWIIHGLRSQENLREKPSSPFAIN